MSPCKHCHFNGGEDICEGERETDRQTWSDRKANRENASVHIWLTSEGQFSGSVFEWDLK